MAILITGGAGYIGTHTMVELLNAGRELVVVDNFINSKPCALDRVKQITGRDFKFYEVDLLDYDALERVFKENNIDSCIHFAGLKAVGESCQKPLWYYHNNITGTLNLCDIMQKYGAKRIVFSSSATVYGKPDIAFIGKKVAVFCDSEFWHGYDWEHKNLEIKSNRDFWIPKIERNMARDQEVNEQLKADGWLVLRFWGKEIKKDLQRCADQIEKAVKER